MFVRFVFLSRHICKRCPIEYVGNFLYPCAGSNNRHAARETMARSKGNVQESLKALRDLEDEHRGTPLESRIRMLRLLKERPGRTLADVGPMVGRSERSVQRWWEIYQKQGLQVLMNAQQRGGKPRRIDGEGLAAFQHKLEIDGFSQLKDAQQWLEQEFGVRYSRSGLWHLMRREMRAGPRGWTLLSDDPAGPVTGRAGAGGDPSTPAMGISAQAIRFLNALPTSSDAVEWGSKFRTAIREVLGDVDRVSVNVNLDCSLSNPEEYRPGMTITHRVTGGQTEDGSLAVEKRGMKPSERLLEDVRRQGFQFDLYHTPCAFDYYYGGHAYLGTILLWREIGKPAVEEATVRLMAELEPFLIFALSDLVARHQSERPIGRVFHDALEDLVAEAELSPQEERIVVLQLMGHSYKEMADILSVTVDTVKKHFKQIHKKTRTRGQAELFAKYFTSRLVPERFGESP
jgi:transposase